MNYNLAFLLIANILFSSCEKDEVVSPNPIPTDNSPRIVIVDKEALSVNVMGTESLPLPTFSSLKAIPGKVRGWVKDPSGKALAGVVIGIRSSYLAGYYSSAQGISDAKGYYEFTPPKGMAEYYVAGYKIPWGTGVAALSLHPADGKLESFVTTDGAVENFVLLPYGITSQEQVQSNPHNPSSYYGAAIYLSWYSAEDNDDNAPSFAVKEGSNLEITLNPVGKMLDGTAGRSITIKKKAGIAGNFRINNIPVGNYTISLKADGKSIKLRDNNGAGQLYGMKPAETTTTGQLLFWPDQSQASMVTPQMGTWRWVDLRVENL